MTSTIEQFDVATATTLQRVFSPKYGADLIVNQVSYGQVPVEDVFSGAALPIEATLTADGRHYDRRGWHEGAEAEAVYVERHTREGCVFHGWIDSVSRRLVQAG